MPCALSFIFDSRADIDIDLIVEFGEYAANMRFGQPLKAGSDTVRVQRPISERSAITLSCCVPIVCKQCLDFFQRLTLRLCIHTCMFHEFDLPALQMSTSHSRYIKLHTLDKPNALLHRCNRQTTPLCDG